MSKKDEGFDQEYEHIRSHYLAPEGQWACERIDRVIGALNLGSGEQVLDLGCGTGTFSFHSFQAGAKPVGLDRDPAVLLKGRRAAKRFAGVETPRVNGDASRIPFQTDTFDVVINADFIEHTPSSIKQAIYCEMYRVMKPGGRGLVYTPNLNRVRWELFGEKLKKIAGRRPAPVPSWQEYVDPDHFGLTTPGLTRIQLQEAGFQTEMGYYEFHFPAFSRIIGFNRIAGKLFSSEFANRFMVRIRKESKIGSPGKGGINR